MFRKCKYEFFEEALQLSGIEQEENMCHIVLNAILKKEQTNITVNNHSRCSMLFFMDVIFLIAYKWC